MFEPEDVGTLGQACTTQKAGRAKLSK